MKSLPLHNHADGISKSDAIRHSQSYVFSRRAESPFFNALPTRVFSLRRRRHTA